MCIVHHNPLQQLAVVQVDSLDVIVGEGGFGFHTAVATVAVEIRVVGVGVGILGRRQITNNFEINLGFILLLVILCHHRMVITNTAGRMIVQQ